MAAIAQVEPLTTARALRGPFDYLLPDGLRDQVGVGSMLVVPFGRRELVGVVVGLTDRSELDAGRLLAPRRTIGGGVPAELVELADWIADEYCSTRARALGLLLPPGSARGVGASRRLVVELTDAGRAALVAPDTRLSGGQREALERLIATGATPASMAGPGHAALRRLEARGLVSLESRVVGRRPTNVAIGARRAAPPTLNATQAAALARIETSIDARQHASFLLHGVTGSGKTEIYLRATAAALARGRSAIVLVPEIGLTPQTVGRFVDRFGDTVAVLHSRLGVGERHDEWLRLRSGEARVCVGPRSAVFAPVADLGLIVVDEEHDASYKHEGDPRYDARRIAARRAETIGAVLVAGSATPRPESYLALERLRLPQRIDGRELPRVRVLDMRGVRGALHPDTIAALGELRRSGGKGIVLLNRRGWSNFLSCRACGRVWGCPQCDVSLVLHRDAGRIACHHCGHDEPVPRRCCDCRSTDVARHGAGTERLQQELSDAFGGFPVFRLDADVAAARGQAAAVLARFERAPRGLLVGTQMVAKGHDFDDVALGVVLDADATLRFPDFRAEERTFSLVAQLAGRAGRGPGADGRVLVQTLAPDAPCIVLAARHDADAFLTAELARRATLGYPPHGELIRVISSSPDADTALAAATAVRARIDAPGATLLGPAPLFRLRGKARAQLVVKTPRRAPAVQAVGAAVAAVAADRSFPGVSLSVDVDPQQL